VQRSRIHQILQNPIYGGRFVWKGRLIEATHEPLVSLELWEKVQRQLTGRGSGQHAKGRREFSYSGLIRCGHCGCMLVAEIKKERYIYYHCSRARRRCTEPYTREEKLDEKFAQLLGSLRFDEEVLAWVVAGLRESHAAAVRFREEAAERLQEEIRRIERRLDRLYTDMIDGVIDAPQHERLSKGAREELVRLQAEVEQHRRADHAHVDDGVRLLELAQRAEELFLSQEPQEKRRLLNLVVSNSTWQEGELTVELRKPFDVLRDTVEAVAVQSAAPELWNSGAGLKLQHQDSKLNRIAGRYARFTNLLGLDAQWVHRAGNTILAWDGSTRRNSELFKLDAAIGDSWAVELTQAFGPATMTLAAKNETVQTPAGTFSDCLLFTYRAPQVADAGWTRIWLAPGVGVVKYGQNSIMGEVVFELRSATIQGTAYPRPVVNGGGVTVSLNTDRFDYTFPRLAPVANIYATVEFTVDNATGAPIPLTFSSGQSFDIELVDSRTGTVAWRWSDGRFFTMAIRQVNLDGKLSFRDSVPLTAVDADYEVRMYLTTTPSRPYTASAPIRVRVR